MDNEPNSPEIQTDNPITPATNIPESNASAIETPNPSVSTPQAFESAAPISTTPPAFGQQVEKSKPNKLILIVGAILALAIVAVVVLLVLPKPDNGSQESASTAQDDKSKKEKTEEKTPTETTDPEKDPTPEQPETERHTETREVPYLGSLECYIENSRLDYCIIPNSIVQNNQDGYLYSTTDATISGKLGLFDGYATITSEGDTYYNITIPESSKAYSFGGVERSFSYTFSEPVIFSGIGGFGQSPGAEHALFVTKSGALYYVSLSDIIDEKATMKQLEAINGAVAVISGGVNTQGGGWHTNYVVCANGTVYDLTELGLQQ